MTDENAKYSRVVNSGGSQSVERLDNGTQLNELLDEYERYITAYARGQSSFKIVADIQQTRARIVALFETAVNRSSA